MNKEEKIISVLVSICIAILSIIFIVKPKQEFSLNENRYLAKFPKYSFYSLKSGKYMKNIENYFIDQFPLRDSLMGLKTTYNKLIGQTVINDVYIAWDGYLIERFNKMKNLDRIASKINSFQKEFKDANIQVLISPTSISVNGNKLPKYAITESQMEYINMLYSKLDTKNINIYEELIESTNQTFYKTDHHWTSYGAYIAYLKYCTLNNIEDVKYNSIKTITNEFYGTLYSKTNDYLIKPDNIDIFEFENTNYEVNYVDKNLITNTLYNEDYLSKKDKYSYFLDNNHSLIIITNKNVNNNDSLLIIKDSYANSFVPLIVNNYKNVYVIDPRYYKDSIIDYAKDNDIGNVLFLYNINTIDNDLGIISIH